MIKQANESLYYSSSLPEKYLTFLKAVVGLQSFPVAVFYMVLVPTSLLWKKFSSPLGLQKVKTVLTVFKQGTTPSKLHGGFLVSTLIS